MKSKSDLFIFNHKKEILKILNKWQNKQYYDIRNLLNCDCQYLINFGEKSNGKSTASQMVMCIIFWLFGAQSVLLRLYDEDFKKNRAQGMFNGVPVEFIKDLTNNKYDCIVYKQFQWFFGKFDVESEKYILCERPFCYRQCILNAGSSFQYPDVELIFFDEFIRKDTQRNVYDEFVEFQTVISTIKRNKTSLQIIMSGNTINYFSIYFEEMGLTNIRKQKQNTIDIYTYGNSSLRVAVEYCGTPEEKTRESNVYFAFNNPKLKSITTGSWMLDLYPHLPHKYKPKDVVLTYFIKFDAKIFQCDIVSESDGATYTYIFDDLTKTPDFNNDIIYKRGEDTRNNISNNIFSKRFMHNKIIASYFENDKVFYKSNEIGDIIHAFIKS